jgi:hypothetical protein
MEATCGCCRRTKIRIHHSNIFTHEPKGILVIGNTNQLNSFEKRNSFELYRQNVHNPEIITFDELLERAKFIVGDSNIEMIDLDNSDDYELPF